MDNETWFQQLTDIGKRQFFHGTRRRNVTFRAVIRATIMHLNVVMVSGVEATISSVIVMLHCIGTLLMEFREAHASRPQSIAM